MPTRSRRCSRALFVCLILTTSMLPAEDSHATRSLFDGRTLEGWEGDPQHWRVENGAIVGEIPPGQSLNHNTWLVWKGGQLADFDLRLSADGEEIVYTYDTQADRTGITTLLQTLSEAGIRFRDLSTSQSSLEEIFVNLVRERA